MYILVLAVVSGHNIMDYGAIPTSSSTEACFRNAAAIESAFAAAIRADDTGDREVLIPAGEFYSMPFQADNAANITFTIEGVLRASSNNKDWPVRAGESGADVLNFITFVDMDNLTIQGNGVIDGQGFMWW